MSEQKTERTVADIMSTPVVTATAAETIAARPRGCASRRSGSVVIVDGDGRATGILTERDMLRFAAAGSDASTAKVSEWMTSEPDTVVSAVERVRRSRASPSTATGTSRSSTADASSGSCRCATSCASR